MRTMTEEQADHSRWAWDRAPTDGSPPGPVYIGDMEDWSLEETKKRRDTFRDPWGGVWTQPLRKGATKAKWGTRTFDSGRYRCCKDSRECGVQVAVKQGPIMAWHFQRQWTYGNNRKYQWSCKNESDYKGPSRFHNIVVNEIYRHLHRKQRFLNQAIQTLQKEKDLTVRQQSGELSVFRPDIFVKLGNDSWYTIEVILTHPPEREVHEACNQNLIEINLNELHCLDSDREFNKWVQNGGVQEILGLESSLAQRKRRWNDRNKRIEVDREKAFRRSIEGHISKCRIKFGFHLDIDIESITNIEQVTRAFEQENTHRRWELEAREGKEKFDNEISEAVERNIEKYGERIHRATNTYSSPDEVDRIYNFHFTRKAEDEKRKADMEKRHAEIQAEVARCEELYEFKIGHVNFLNLSGPEAVEPHFEEKKMARLAVKAEAEEWSQVSYPQAIAQLEKEFGVTEEEVGCDSDFSLKEIREGFEWLAQDRKKEEAKRAKREAGKKMKLEQRARSRAPFQENQKPKDRSEKQVPLTTHLPDPRVSDDSVWDALLEKKTKTEADRRWNLKEEKRILRLLKEKKEQENETLKQARKARKQEYETRKQARKARKQEFETRKRASKDITPEEEKKGYIKRLKKLQKEVHRTGLTARQSREAQDNLKRFVKANKGKYEDDES